MKKKKFLVKAWRTEADYDARKFACDIKTISGVNNESEAVKRALNEWKQAKRGYGYAEAEEVGSSGADFGRHDRRQDDY